MVKKPTPFDDDDETTPKPAPAKPSPASAADPLVHPDPEGKMRSYAPGHGPGPDGEAVELQGGQKDQNNAGTVGFNPVHLPQRSE